MIVPNFPSLTKLSINQFDGSLFTEDMSMEIGDFSSFDLSTSANSGISHSLS